MTDPDLVAALTPLQVGLDAFTRSLYVLARVRVQRGESLKPEQRRRLLGALTTATGPHAAATEGEVA